jgi:hypothetical protein
MNPEQREADPRFYGVDRDALAGAGPAVVSINGVVASLAVTEFMVFVTGLRDPVGQLTYRADMGVVRASLDRPSPDCYYCTGLWGSSAEATEWLSMVLVLCLTTGPALKRFRVRAFGDRRWPTTCQG